MSDDHKCGPEHAVAFFNALDAVFKQFPEMENQYVIKCVDHETDIMGVDFSKQIGKARIENNTVITEFVSAARYAEETADGGFCCQWEHSGQTGGGTWRCTARW